MLTDLCEKFEVRRTPVNQAVKMLSKDGILVTIYETGGRLHPEQRKKDSSKERGLLENKYEVPQGQ